MVEERSEKPDCKHTKTMKKIITIVGARPQFIKAAAISHVVRDKHSGVLEEDILHTGQHYDDAMSGSFFRELDIPAPRYNLGVGSGPHGAQTAAMLQGIENIMLSEHYDGALIYGDTNSTLAGALAAAKLNVPVFHVEAGLRSFNRTMPEEVNRVVSDHLSSILFAPTATAMNNLHQEGFDGDRVLFSGDVMLDNVLHYSQIAAINRPLPQKFILATVHRDFNTDNTSRLKTILAALCEAAEELDSEVVFPVHPRTRNKLDSMTDTRIGSRIRMVSPLSYLETLAALRECSLVATDSGGLQKEAYFSGKGCVVLRPETEWTEIVDAGAATLVDADRDRIVEAARRMWDTPTKRPDEFGDGKAAEHIVDEIISKI